MSDDSPGAILKAHCNRCLSETNHRLLKRTQKDDAEEDDQGNYIFSCRTVFEMLECCGCENITLRRKYRGDDAPEGSTDYFPPAISRPAPKWLNIMPFWRHQEIYGLMKETYGALHTNSHRLALMGARAVIDLVMQDKLGDIGGFERKLKEMVEKGLLSRKNAEFLEAALEAGHAASHRGYAADSDVVNQVMDIVENLLQAVYVLEGTARSLRKKVPARKIGKRNP